MAFPPKYNFNQLSESKQAKVHGSLEGGGLVLVVCCDMMSRGHLFPTCWTRKEKKGKHTVAVVVLKRTWALHKNKKDKEERDRAMARRFGAGKRKSTTNYATN